MARIPSCRVGDGSKKLSGMGKAGGRLADSMKPTVGRQPTDKGEEAAAMCAVDAGLSPLLLFTSAVMSTTTSVSIATVFCFVIVTRLTFFLSISAAVHLIFRASI